MTTTALPRWKFERVIDGIPCVPTVEADQARADLEAEVQRLREALKDLLDHYAEYGSDPYYWKETNAITDKAHTALENKQ